MNITNPEDVFRARIITAPQFPVIASGQRAQAFNDWHLSVALMVFHKSHDLKYAFISCLEDLPDFCNNLFYLGINKSRLYSGMQVWLDVQDPRALKEGQDPPEAVQESLLLPFGILKGFEALNTDVCAGEPMSAVEKKLRIQLEEWVSFLVSHSRFFLSPTTSSVALWCRILNQWYPGLRT